MTDPQLGTADGVDEAVLLGVLADVKDGDFSARMPLEWTGVAGKIADRLNDVIAANQTLGAELARVSRVVGKEGKLSERVAFRGSDRAWSEGIEAVNSLIDDLVRPTSEMQRVLGAVAGGDLAANLTNQVRAIADVATAVTEGDLTQQVGVQASGEVAVLKDKLNEMIRNLRETTRQNTEQDWLKTNLERFTRMLQGQRDLATVSSMILSELAPLVSAQHGVFYTLASSDDSGEPVLRYQAGYGYTEREHVASHCRLGAGLIGQCAKEKERILLTDVPGDYVKINSGIGESAPLNIIVLPILFEGSVRAVVELGSFSRFSPAHQAFLDQLTERIGLVLHTIEANTHATRLAEQNIEVERKNQEVELAKRLVEDKAEQLAISSQYKSEFFSNMSHELRTPLNSLLILARDLADNPEQNLTEAQVQYASVIHSSGTDLLRLLDDILDLAKVESGTVTLQISDLLLVELQDALQRDFGHVAEQKGVAFSVELAPDLPPTIATDPRRLRQVLKNLISNAFKFTDHGAVSVRVRQADAGWNPANGALGRASAVTAFSIGDTGIGITAEMQRRIFEAFAQADGTTARQYGGTGLGLSISRELVRLLGGEIALRSTPEQGSTFTVFLPSAAPGADSGADIPPATRAAHTPQVPSAPQGPTPQASAAQPSPPAERQAGAGLAGRKVLVVDDDFRNIFALTALLERGHLEVVSAESGEEGVALLKRTPDVDIVLVDIMMPVMDGYATIRAMRKLPSCRDLPIVAVTANVAAETRQRCIDAGASDYVSKPVESADLLLVLDEKLAPHPPAGRSPAAVCR